ncbi:MAG TPA: hypothetical protein VN522_13820 [Solirubrobacterales bacterium]|nr:hypothetical protein [Solirubrobacterales bacterium]
MAGGARPSSGHAAVPVGFFGTVSQGPVEAGELARMEGVVGTLRIPVYWAGCEPSPGIYEFAGLDAEVGAAAERGIRVQPFVYGTPAAYSADPLRPPLAGAARGAWRKFLAALVDRYGGHGSFWTGRARREPVRIWQVWNEPNFGVFWQPRPDPAAYARLLAASAPVIRAADRRAQVALAGVAPVGDGLPTWTFLRRLFRLRGVRRDFDLVSLHPYSASIAQLDYAIVKVRRVMVRAGLGARPLLISELGVASEGDAGSVFTKGRDGQARFLAGAFGRLLEMRSRWHLAGVDWFSLQDDTRFDPYCSFCQGSGLFEVDGAPKPAWSRFRHIALSAVHGGRARQAGLRYINGR